MSYTKGPWHWENSGDGKYDLVGADGTVIITAEGVNGSEYDDSLIEAATDLLEALQMVQEAAIDMRGDDFNLTTDQWSKFHAAIKKATQ